MRSPQLKLTPHRTSSSGKHSFVHFSCTKDQTGTPKLHTSGVLLQPQGKERPSAAWHRRCPAALRQRALTQQLQASLGSLPKNIPRLSSSSRLATWTAELLSIQRTLLISISSQTCPFPGGQEIYSESCMLCSPPRKNGEPNCLTLLMSNPSTILGFED